MAGYAGSAGWYAAACGRWWELPAYGAAFGLYVYLWTIASLLAWFRLMAGRVGWTKTSRVVREAEAR